MMNAHNKNKAVKNHKVRIIGFDGNHKGITRRILIKSKNQLVKPTDMVVVANDFEPIGFVIQRGRFDNQFDYIDVSSSNDNSFFNKSVKAGMYMTVFKNAQTH